MAVTGLDDTAGSPIGTEAASDGPVDGRNVRRERNVASALDVVLEMFAEDALFPTMDSVAERSGLSLRSLYRYFADPSELVHAAIERQQMLTNDLAHIPSIGEGPLAGRIDDFVAMRLRVHEQVGAMFRATLANANRHSIVAETLANRRRSMSEQFEQQFAPELKGSKTGRDALLHAGDALTQLDTIHLMASQGATTKQIRAALERGLRSLFGA